MLSDLGRREEALAVAEEAVRLCAPWPRRAPTPLVSILARSLWVLGDLYGKSEQTGPAIETLAEGVGLLTPVFIAVPAAVAQLMGGLVQSYLARCEAAGREPDAELLAPVIAQFERSNATEEHK